MLTAVSFILVFGILVFVHEFGHFIMAKASGVGVIEFAIGMGPVIFKKTWHGTLYSIRLLPFGGFTMMEDDPDKEGCFEKKPLHSKFIVLVAGAVFNMLLGCLLLSIITAMNGYVGTTVVAKFEEDSASAHYLRVGDKITHLNGHRVRTSNDITYELMRDADGLLDVGLIRDGEKRNIAVQFKLEEIADGVVAINMDFLVAAVDAKPLDYITYPINWSLSLIKQVWGSFIDLLTGRVPVNQLSGPVGIVSAIGQATKMGLKPLLMFSAFISINLGVFNLLPLPILDGGKILQYVLEKLRKKPFSEKTLTVVTNMSLAFIVLLVLYATGNDILRLIKG